MAKNCFLCLLSCIITLPVFLSAQTSVTRKLRPSDVYRLQTVADPQVSPEGNWVAYTLTSIDSVLNKRNTDIWCITSKESVLIVS